MRADWSGDACSIARGVGALADPWTMVVLREVLSGRVRFDVIRDKTGIADNILSRRLKRMVELGLLTRSPYFDRGRERFEYLPTRAAADALPILHAYSLWATMHLPTGARPSGVAIVCRRCGAESSTGEACSGCGAALTTATTAWIKPTSTDRVPVPLLDPGAEPAPRATDRDRRPGGTP